MTPPGSQNAPEFAERANAWFATDYITPNPHSRGTNDSCARKPPLGILIYPAGYRRTFDQFLVALRIAPHAGSQPRDTLVVLLGRRLETARGAAARRRVAPVARVDDAQPATSRDQNRQSIIGRMRRS